MTASTLTATVGDPAAFRSGREYAAWLGLLAVLLAGKRLAGGVPLP